MKAKIRQYVLDRLWQKALSRIEKEHPYVIAITGSVGKTSAKEALATILEISKHTVVKTRGNLGTETGVPLSLLGYEEAPSTPVEWAKALAKKPKALVGKRPYYVLEFSADKPGDIAFLTKQIPLDAGVITAITPVHMGAYPNFAGLVKEKFSLLDGLKSTGYAVLNADDPTIAKHAASHRYPVLWYGIRQELRQTGVWASNLSYGEHGLSCKISFVHKKGTDHLGNYQDIEAHTSLIGTHQLYPVLAAAAVAYREGVSAADIKRGIETYQVPNGRGRIIPGRKNTVIIDDSYNASPESVKAGLRMLRSLAGKRRVVAILGTMNELGDMSEQAHREVAEAAAKTIDFLIAVGPFSEVMVAAAVAAGLPQLQTFHFSSPEALLTHLDQMVEYHDLVYVKASQNGMRLERAVRRLMAKPEQAKELLVRQGNHWRKK